MSDIFGYIFAILVIGGIGYFIIWKRIIQKPTPKPTPVVPPKPPVVVPPAPPPPSPPLV